MKILIKNRIVITIFFSLFLISTYSSLNIFISFQNLNKVKSSTKTSLNLTDDPSGSFVATINDKNYLIEYISREKIEDIKKEIEPREYKKNYNVLINGHGTGLAPPTENDLDKLIGKKLIRSIVPEVHQRPQDIQYRPPMANYDLSTDIYFPAVGNQGGQGSCAAWALTYYVYGYLEAKDYGWDASSGNPDYLMSPAWTYNKVAIDNYGSWMTTNAEIILEWGCATMTTMPYDDADYYSWGNEPAWREAPNHRLLDYYLIDFDEVDPDLTIDAIKSFISSDTPITFAFDSGEYNAGFMDGNYILSSAEYDSLDYNHAQTIVGFDDSISDDGDIGAFRVVNSWGTGFGDSGYYWMTYECLKEIGFAIGDFYLHLCVVTDRIDYQPDLIATWEFDPAPTRKQDIITLGVGPYATPFDYKTPWYEYDDSYVFPDFMAIDISEFKTYYDLDNDIFFYLDVGASITSGTISSFLIERYTGGVLEEITFKSIDVPQITPGYVRNTFMDFDHEISVRLKVPENPEIFETYLINATVQNIGINDESNVELYLYLDKIIVNSAMYSTLSAGASETIDYLWTPMAYDTFNFTVFSPPKVGEFTEENNFKYSLVTIKFIQNYTMTVGYPYTWIDASGGTELILYDDDYAAILLPFNFTFYDQTFSTVYLCSNGYLSFYDTMPWQYNNVPFPSGDPLDYYMIAPFWDDMYPSSGGHIYVQSFGTYWVAEWQDIYHINDEIIGSFQVVLSETGEIMFSYDYLDYIEPYNGYTCGLNLGVDTEYHNYYQGLSNSTDDLSIFFYLESVENDLRVKLDTPSAPALDASYIITAMVQNYGEHNESNVEFYLYYDEILVNSTFIPFLQIGAKEILTYNWTPTTYRTYNLTAYAPPVINETYISNNRVQRLIAIHPIKLFDGMFLNYSFEINDNIYSWNLLYSKISETIFHNDYSIYYGDSLYDMGHWEVDSQTRIMSNSYGAFSFGSGVHTPIWVFPDISIGNLIPIAIDAEGDHMFYVARDLVYDLPGFGQVEVWELEDLDEPGGVAWYEKSTGILLKGNFLYYEGVYNYTFGFIDTNADIKSLVSGEKAIPGYNLCLLISTIGVVSVLLIKNRIKKAK